jgi:hypothetical protein
MASADIAGLLAAADEHNVRSSSRQITAAGKQQQPASSMSSDISALLAHAEAAEREIVGKRCVAHPYRSLMASKIIRQSVRPSTHSSTV